ncbi:MAG: sterol desaturase family protein [Acidobacteria bacterium]|nr:sterol desaturase family protein [Acidobacteriota bacterium]
MIDLNEAQLYRTLGFVLGLAALLLWEWRAPRHHAQVRWQTRWRVNLSLLLMNALASSLVCWLCWWFRSSLVDALWWQPFNAASRLLIELLILDAAIYWQHRAMHEIPWLWRFHQVHHSDLHLDVTSASRFHLGEVLSSGGFKLAVVLALGISLEALILFEALVLLAAQFQHANVKLSDGAEQILRRLVMTPLLHYAHHAQAVERRNTNYGSLLACWDRWFATWRAAEAVETIGVPEYQQAERLNVFTLLWMPFRRSTDFSL